MLSPSASSLWPHTKQLVAGMAGDLNVRLQSRQTTLAGHGVDFRGGSHHVDDYDDGWVASLLRTTTGGFIDIGCNIGFFGLLACVLDPERDVLLIDANTEALALAAGNLVRSGCSAHASFQQAFVSASEGEIDFFTVGSGEAGSRYAGHADTARKRDAHQRVSSRTLDQIVTTWGRDVGLVKIDVEGAEREVLEGAGAVVTQHRPRVVVEMHSPPELPMVENARSVLDWCRRSDYDAWYLAQHERLHDPDQIAHRGRCHLLLQPSNQPYPPGLDQVPQGASLDAVLASS